MILMSQNETNLYRWYMKGIWDGLQQDIVYRWYGQGIGMATR